jgi:hippurate hydrolase
MQTHESLSPLLDAAKSISSRLVDLRRRIHAEPELGLDTPATRAKILEEIEGLGLEVTLHERSSGIVALLRGGQPGRRLLLRGDMDALPMPEETNLDFRSRTEGRMHACGHDAHVAMLTGAAHLLSERRAELAGEIVFMFQPGEEAYGGADVMLGEGMPEVDGAFAIHVAPQLPTGLVGTRPGSFMASYDDFEIVVQGRGGHASSVRSCPPCRPS